MSSKEVYRQKKYHKDLYTICKMVLQHKGFSNYRDRVGEEILNVRHQDWLKRETFVKSLKLQKLSPEDLIMTRLHCDEVSLGHLVPIKYDFKMWLLNKSLFKT